MRAMEQMEKLVDFLGIVLGEHYEIVLQDLSESKRQIVAITHGEISGRDIGAPLTNLALKIISDCSWKNDDYQCNYQGMTKDNRMLRSSTFYIKENDELVGMLCINVDISYYKMLSDTILKLGGFCQEEAVTPDSVIREVPEKFPESIADITHHTIEMTLNESGDIPAERMTQEERLSIVKQLSERGVFLLKGAISEVAKQLVCSEASIYRYLSILSKQNRETTQ